MSIENYKNHYISHIYISPIGNDWFCTGSVYAHPQDIATRVVSNQTDFDNKLLRKFEYRVDTLGGSAQPSHHYYYPLYDDNTENFTPISSTVSVSDQGTRRLTDKPFIEDPFTKWYYFAVRMKADPELFYKTYLAELAADDKMWSFPNGATELLSVSFGKLVVRDLGVLATNNKIYSDGGQIAVGTYFRVLDPSFPMSTGNYAARETQGRKSGTVTLEVTALNFDRNEISYKIVPQSSHGTTPSNFTFKRGQIVAICNENVLYDLTLPRNITGPFQTPLPAYRTTWTNGWGFNSSLGTNVLPTGDMFASVIGKDYTHVMFHFQSGDYINTSFNVSEGTAFATQLFIGHGECRFMLNGTNFNYASPDINNLHDNPHMSMFNLIFDGNYGDIGVPWTTPDMKILASTHTRNNTRATEIFYNCSWIGPDYQRCRDLNITGEMISAFTDKDTSFTNTFRSFIKSKILNFTDMKSYLGSTYTHNQDQTTFWFRGEIKNCTFHKVPEMRFWDSTHGDVYTKVTNTIFSECGDLERTDKLDVLGFIDGPDTSGQYTDEYFRRGGNLLTDSTAGSIESGFLVSDYMAYRDSQNAGPIIYTNQTEQMSLINKEQWTISCWWRPISLINPSFGRRYILSSKQDTSVSQWVLAQDDGDLLFSVGAGTASASEDGGLEIIRVKGALKTFQWHHLAVVFDETTNPMLKVYVNGKMLATQNGYDSSSMWNTTYPTANVVVGNSYIATIGNINSLYGDIAKVYVHGSKAVFSSDFEDNLPLGDITFDRDFDADATTYDGDTYFGQYSQSTSPLLQAPSPGDFTWCVKVRVHSNPSTWVPVISTMNTSNEGVALQRNGTNMYWHVGNGVSTWGSSTTSTVNVWEDWTFTYHKDALTNYLRAWKNGAYVSTTAVGEFTDQDAFTIARGFYNGITYLFDGDIKEIEVYNESIQDTNTHTRTFGDPTTLGFADDSNLVFRSQNGAGVDDTGPNNLGSTFSGYIHDREFFYQGGTNYDYYTVEPLNTRKLFDDGYYYNFPSNQPLYKNQTHITSVNKNVVVANKQQVIEEFDTAITQRLTQESSLKGLDFHGTQVDSELFPFIDVHDNTGLGPNLSGGPSFAKNYGFIKSKGLQVDAGADNEVILGSGQTNQFTDYIDGPLTFTNDISSMFVLLHDNNATPAGKGTHPYLSYNDVYVDGTEYSRADYNGSTYTQEVLSGSPVYHTSYNYDRVLAPGTGGTTDRRDNNGDQFAISEPLAVPMSGFGDVMDRRVSVYFEFYVPDDGFGTNEDGWIIGHESAPYNETTIYRGFKVRASYTRYLQVYYGSYQLQGGSASHTMQSNSQFSRGQWHSVIIYFDELNGARLACSWDILHVANAEFMSPPGTNSIVTDDVWWNDARFITLGVCPYFITRNATYQNDISKMSSVLSSEYDKFQGHLRNLYVFAGSADLTLSHGDIPVAEVQNFDEFNAPYPSDFLVSTNNITLSSSPVSEVVADSTYIIDEYGQGLQWAIDTTPLSGTGTIGTSGIPDAMVALSNTVVTDYNTADFGVYTLGISAHVMESGTPVSTVVHDVGDAYRMMIDVDMRVNFYQNKGSGFNLIGQSTGIVASPLTAYFVMSQFNTAINDVEEFDISLIPSDPMDYVQLQGLIGHDPTTMPPSAFHIVDGGIYLSTPNGSGYDNEQGVRFYTPGTTSAIDLNRDYLTERYYSNIDITTSGQTWAYPIAGNWSTDATGAFTNSAIAPYLLYTTYPNPIIGQDFGEAIDIRAVDVSQNTYYADYNIIFSDTGVNDLSGWTVASGPHTGSLAAAWTDYDVNTIPTSAGSHQYWGITPVAPFAHGSRWGLYEIEMRKRMVDMSITVDLSGEAGDYEEPFIETEEYLIPTERWTAAFEFRADAVSTTPQVLLSTTANDTSGFSIYVDEQADGTHGVTFNCSEGDADAKKADVYRSILDFTDGKWHTVLAWVQQSKARILVDGIYYSEEIKIVEGPKQGRHLTIGAKHDGTNKFDGQIRSIEIFKQGSPSTPQQWLFGSPSQIGYALTDVIFSSANGAGTDDIYASNEIDITGTIDISAGQIDRELIGGAWKMKQPVNMMMQNFLPFNAGANPPAIVTNNTIQLKTANSRNPDLDDTSSIEVGDVFVLPFNAVFFGVEGEYVKVTNIIDLSSFTVSRYDNGVPGIDVNPDVSITEYGLSGAGGSNYITNHNGATIESPYRIKKHLQNTKLFTKRIKLDEVEPTVFTKFNFFQDGAVAGVVNKTGVRGVINTPITLSGSNVVIDHVSLSGIPEVLQAGDVFEIEAPEILADVENLSGFWNTEILDTHPNPLIVPRATSIVSGGLPTGYNGLAVPISGKVFHIDSRNYELAEFAYTHGTDPYVYSETNSQIFPDLSTYDGNAINPGYAAYGNASTTSTTYCTHELHAGNSMNVHPFSLSSIYFAGNGHYLEFNTSDHVVYADKFAVGTGDFAFSVRVRRQVSTDNYGGTFSYNAGTGERIEFSLEYTKIVIHLWNPTTILTFSIPNSSIYLTAGAWRYVEINRESGQLRVSVNGYLCGAAQAHTYDFQTMTGSGYMRIGHSEQATTEFAYGHYNDITFVNGDYITPSAVLDAATWGISAHPTPNAMYHPAPFASPPPTQLPLDVVTPARYAMEEAWAFRLFTKPVAIPDNLKSGYITTFSIEVGGNSGSDLYLYRISSTGTETPGATPLYQQKVLKDYRLVAAKDQYSVDTYTKFTLAEPLYVEDKDWLGFRFVMPVGETVSTQNYLYTDTETPMLSGNHVVLEAQNGGTGWVGDSTPSRYAGHFVYQHQTDQQLLTWSTLNLGNVINFSNGGDIDKTTTWTANFENVNTRVRDVKHEYDFQEILKSPATSPEKETFLVVENYNLDTKDNLDLKVLRGGKDRVDLDHTATFTLHPSAGNIADAYVISQGIGTAGMISNEIRIVWANGFGAETAVKTLSEYPQSIAEDATSSIEALEEEIFSRGIYQENIDKAAQNITYRNINTFLDTRMTDYKSSYRGVYHAILPMNKFFSEPIAANEISFEISFVFR